MSSPDGRADVIVVGAGICGAAVAHFLARRDRAVVVLERGEIASGTSSRGEGNVLVCDKPEGVERSLALLGRELWESLGAVHPSGRVTRTGALLLSRDADGTDREEVREIEPALAPGVTVVREPGDLMVDPPGMTQALLEGIEVRTGVEVVEVEAGVGVRLRDGSRIAARDVVVCAGPWSGALCHLPVQPRKGQLVALAVDPTAPPLVRHKLVEAAYVEAAAASDATLLIASVIEQTLDGDEVLVGSSRQRVGFDDTVDPAVTAAMLERAYGWVPALRGLPVSRAWAGLRPWLPDGLPAIGPLADGLWTSTGHEGSGVCLGPVSGLLLAQLMAGEEPLIDPGPFDPRRF